MIARSKSAKFFRMALGAVAVALAAVLFNSYARLSEAGLGCPDWPGCYGMLFAPVTAQDIAEARAIEGEQGLEGERAWKETLQRAIAVSLTFVLIRLTVLGWQLRKYKRTQQVLIPAATAVFVLALSAFAALAFTHRFKPLVQMLQLSGGMAVVGLLWWIVLREQRIFRSLYGVPRVRGLRVRALLALGLVAGQIALGGWSMVNYAGLACPDFPTCQGGWWPPMEFAEAFTLWRDIGLHYEGRMLHLPAATAIHMAHRLGGVITLLYVGWLGLHVWRVGGDGHLCRYGLLMLAMLLLATVLGVMQVILHLPLALAVAHNAAAAALLMSVVTFYHVVRPPRTGAQQGR
jgi:cytochrome c oxidase assembly protein subunit 15